MSATLRDLVRGERVAHREDADWAETSGTVEFVVGNAYVVEWDDVRGEAFGSVVHDRTELIAEDDLDRLATDEHPLNIDGTPFSLRDADGADVASGILSAGFGGAR